MSKVKKFFSSFVFVSLYIISGVFIIARAEGYTFDFEGNVQKTGGMFVQTLSNKTNLLVNTIPLYQDKNTMKLFWLSPQKYTLTLDREGFIPWSKSIQVHSGQIHNFQDIVLVPESISFRPSKTFPKISEDQDFLIRNTYEVYQGVENGTHIFVSRFAKPVQKVFALGSTHMVVLSGGDVYLQDVDGSNGTIIFSGAFDLTVNDFTVFIDNQTDQYLSFDFDMRNWWQKMF